MKQQTSIVPPRINTPLNALRAFEAVARHLSVKNAANELGVTSSAISHQLKTLEDILSMSLIQKVGSRLELTETGQRLLPALSTGFMMINSAITEITNDRKSGPLRLSILPTFAIHWLSPRLADYPFERPGFELLMSTSQAAVDLKAGIADIGIRKGTGQWQGLRSDLLFPETVTLLAHPDFVKGRSTRTVVEKSNLFVSEHRMDNWGCWNNTLPGGPIQPATLTIVDSMGLGIKAALDGAGITLAGLEIARADIDAGRLVPLFDHQIEADAGYWLVYPEALSGDWRIRNLRNWLLSAAGIGTPTKPS